MNFIYFIVIALILFMLFLLVIYYSPIKLTGSLKEGQTYKFYNKTHTFPLKGEYPMLKESSAHKQISLFKELLDILEENKIDYWICTGTLLGCIRHQSIIPWDDDIDIHLQFKDLDKFKTSIKNSKLKILDTRGGGLKIYKGSTYPFIDVVIVEERLINDKIKLDGCFPMKNNVLTFKTGDKLPQEFYFKEDVFPLIRLPFEDFYVNAPKNSQRIIRDTYGENCLTQGYYKPFPLITNHKFNHLLFQLGLISG